MPEPEESTTVNPQASPTMELLGSLLAGILALQGLSSARNDETLARQAVKDNQRESHLNTLAAIQAQYEFDLPQAFAASQMATAWQPGQNASFNAASIVPPVQFQVKPA